MSFHDDELLRRYADGQVSRDALPEHLRVEGDRLARVVAALRADRARAPAALRPAVMRRVRELAQPGWRRAGRWLVAPRTVRVSPLGGALAVAAAVTIVLLARPDTTTDLPRGPTGAAAAAGAGQVVTRFVFVAPNASSVAVTGDFVNWDPHGVPMRDTTGAGVWVAEVRLSPGVHHYAFVVNGSEWRPDPNAVSQVDDGFGQVNSVLLVPQQTSS